MKHSLHIWAGIALASIMIGGTGSALAQSSEPRTGILEEWLASGHADATSTAFTHWNDEGEIPPNCATCHAGAGFRAFYGLDGSKKGVIEHPFPIGGVVDCETCHNDAIDTIQSVPFPSGISVADIGSSATCLTCHQGRQSTVGINKVLTDQAADTNNPELSFINSHYKVAAATLLGSVAKGGYEYAGKTYMGRFSHVPEFAQCTDCHDPHNLEVAMDACVACHKTDSPVAIRFSPGDFDGDGVTTTGIAVEIANLHQYLGGAIISYAEKVSGKPLIYEAHTYPYYFNDTNGNGEVDAGEAIFPNQYKSWTPRLLRAAYNYQFVAKDKGAFVHNPHYALQLLFDSIESLSEATEVTMPDMARP